MLLPKTKLTSSNRIPKKNSIFSTLNLANFVNLGMAITNANNIYQSPSMTVAVITIINLLSKSDAASKNWLNIAKKKTAILGFRKTIKNPLRPCLKSETDEEQEPVSSIDLF